MDVEMKKPLTSCDLNSITNVMLGGQGFSVAQLNQISRVEKVMKKKRLELVDAPLDCFTDSVAVYLVDKKNNLRGSYLLEQGDINRLFVELDIVLMQDNYGEPVSR